MTAGGALVTVAGVNDESYEYHCAGCGEGSDRPDGREPIHAEVNDHAATCRAIPDPHAAAIGDLAREIASDLRAELPRLETKAAAGIALSAAILVGLVGIQTPLSESVAAFGVLGAVFLSSALLLCLAVLLPGPNQRSRSAVLGWLDDDDTQAPTDELRRWERTSYHATVVAELSAMVRTKQHRLRLALGSGFVAVVILALGAGVYLASGGR